MNTNLILNSTGFAPNGMLVSGTTFTGEQILKVNEGGTPARVMFYSNSLGQVLPITKMYYGSTLVFRVDI